MRLTLNYLPILLCLIFSATAATAQNVEVTVTGIVKEKISQQPVAYATAVS